MNTRASRLPPGVRLSLVVAVAANGVIGRGGGLPWRLPSELRNFRRFTLGKPLIMGRRTFQSLKKPLDGRDNIVLAQDLAFTLPQLPDLFLCRSFDEAVGLAGRRAVERKVQEIMVIGGAAVFEAALGLAQRIYWSSVDGAVEGDTFFPLFERSAWHTVVETCWRQESHDQYPWRLEILDRCPL